MPESIIGDDVWLQMTETERIDVVRSGRATLRQLSEGLLDGSDDLRAACRDVLSYTSADLEELPLNISVNTGQSTTPARTFSRESFPRTSKKIRSGLPTGYRGHSSNRHSRTRLLEENIYRLPDGQEYVPSCPAGTLGTSGHRYALLTMVQYERRQRGSVYIRNDGRIFDYSKAFTGPRSELFDTGFTMDDLERTGRMRRGFRNRNDKKRKRSRK